MKSFTGSGLSVDLLWEGLDDNDQQVPQGLYTVRITGPAGVRLDLDQPVDIDLSVMWSDPDTIGLVTRTAPDYDPDVVKHVIGVWNELGWSNHCILMRRDANSVGYLDARIGPRAKKAVRRWIGLTAKRIWFDGHGFWVPNNTYRALMFGSRAYSTDGSVGESVAGILAKYGRNTSSQPFTFVMVDTCSSVGGTGTGDVTNEPNMTTPANGASGWPHAFGMDTINADSENCFIGTNGFCTINDNSGWRQFRKDFWTKLVAPYEPYRAMAQLNQNSYNFGSRSPFDQNGNDGAGNTYRRLSVLGGYADAHSY